MITITIMITKQILIIVIDGCVPIFFKTSQAGSEGRSVGHFLLVGHVLLVGHFLLVGHSLCYWVAGHSGGGNGILNSIVKISILWKQQS